MRIGVPSSASVTCARGASATSRGVTFGRGRSSGAPGFVFRWTKRRPVVRSRERRLEVARRSRRAATSGSRTRARTPREVDRVRDGRLAAGRVVRLVVEEHVDEVRRALVAERRERAQAHEERAVAVEDDDAAIGTRPREAEAEARRAAHRADHVELVRAVVARVELAAGEAGRRDDDVARSDRALHRAERLRRARDASRRVAPGRARVAAHAARTSARDVGFDVELVRRDAVLLHHEANGSPSSPCARRPSRSRAPISLSSVGKYSQRDVHRLEHLRRDLPHQLVLRLVRRPARLAAQRDDHQHRDAEDRVQRGERDDGVAEPRVLHHHDRALAAELGAGRDRDRVAFVRRADVREVGRVDDVVDERLHVRARHARVEREARELRRLDEGLRLDHLERAPAARRRRAC